MSNANPTLLGQANGAGSETALFRDIFSGEVVTAFNNTVVTMDKHDVRHISKGNSATFYATGKTSGGYHTAGQEVLGDDFKQDKFSITTDGVVFAANFLDEVTELTTAYESRSEIANQQGDFLAQHFDKNVLRCGVLAARTAARVDGQTGGVTVTAANMGTDSNVFVASVFAARQSFMERSIPWQGKTYIYLSPAMDTLISQNKDVLNKDWGGSGSYAAGTYQMIAGMPVIVTNNLPDADLTDNTTIAAAGEDPAVILAKYRGNYSKTRGLIMQRDAVGTVKLRDLINEITYDERRFGTLITSRFAVGHGVKNPACAIELATV